MMFNPKNGSYPLTWGGSSRAMGGILSRNNRKACRVIRLMRAPTFNCSAALFKRARKPLSTCSADCTIWLLAWLLEIAHQAATFEILRRIATPTPLVFEFVKTVFAIGSVTIELSNGKDFKRQ
jgi:hypothetical protein